MHQQQDAALRIVGLQQEQVRALNGDRGTWFCGAWMRNGFHEDGFASAQDVVEMMQARDTAMGVAAE